MEIEGKNIAKYLNEELFRKYIRILKLARTPTRDEFSKIALVSAIGVLIIGLVGFVIYELMTIAA